MTVQRDPITAGDIDLFGAGAAFHHVGLVVADIDAAQPGLTKHIDAHQQVTVAFADIHGTTVEFIAPMSADSPVAANLAKGIKLAHLCYAVPNLEAAIDHAAKKGVRLIARPVPAVAFEGRRIAWLFHRNLGLFELVESAR
jgi:methylmalonyl-CoA/ethylmalonyl-CoA epimerase